MIHRRPGMGMTVDVIELEVRMPRKQFDGLSAGISRRPGHGDKCIFMHKLAQIYIMDSGDATKKEKGLVIPTNVVAQHAEPLRSRLHLTHDNPPSNYSIFPPICVF